MIRTWLYTVVRTRMFFHFVLRSTSYHSKIVYALSKSYSSAPVLVVYHTNFSPVLLCEINPAVATLFKPIQRLSRLEGTEVTAKADDKANRPEYLRQLDDSCAAPGALRLKVGAQVRVPSDKAEARAAGLGWAERS